MGDEPRPSGNSVPPGLIPWPKGVSGNPSGRPALKRSPSKALAELNDTAGADYEEMVANFRASRGIEFCAADLKAIAAFKREIQVEQVGVSQLNATLDRLEGKVSQRIEVGADADTMAAVAAAAKAARG